MKKITLIIVFILILLCSIPIIHYGLHRTLEYENFLKNKNVRVFLVYGFSQTSYDKSILSVYASTLKNEGVPFKVISCSDLIAFDPRSLAKNIPAVIFPDMAAEKLPQSMEIWAENYLKNGGNVAVIYNAGIYDRHGLYLKRAVFSRIIGLNYMLYSEKKGKSYVEAFIRFKNKGSEDLFQIPYGNTMDGFLSGYKYGPLEYPIAYTVAGSRLSGKNIYAYGIEKNGKKLKSFPSFADVHKYFGSTSPEGIKKFPAVVLKKYGRGHILYVNLPLGYLNGYETDGFLMGAFIRMFLFKVALVPHLVDSPYGKGGLVVDWHIENYLVRKSIPYMINNHILRKNLKFSFDVSAGSFEDHPGDGRGVDACGKNRNIIKMILPYGVIGTDGGWAHNWWYRNIRDGKFKEKQMTYWINKNNECLQSITGYKIKEYMPSQGIYPQPVSTKIINKLGMIATYYAGNIGSGPSTMFWKGKIISSKVIAFPVSEYGDVASLYELRDYQHISNAGVLTWQKDIVNYCVKNRVVRLWYSHPYDIWEYKYLKAMKSFTNYMEKKQKQGKLLVRPMTYFASFMLRFLKTRYSFISSKDGSLTLFIKNKEGLKGITVALPKNQIKKPASRGGVYKIEEGRRYYYIVFTENIDEDTVRFKGSGRNGNGAAGGF